MNLKEIYDFRCPRWDDLPDKPIFNKNVVVFINKALSSVVKNEDQLTTNMVQNYSKWRYIPEITGRKYDRIHVAYLLVISVTKQILNIKDVKEGAQVLLNHMDEANAYNLFAEALDRSIKRTFESTIKQEDYQFQAFEATGRYATVELVTNAFAMKLLSEMVIESGGYKNLGGN